MKRGGLFGFFLFPYAGLLLLFFTVSTLNRTLVRERTETLVHDQLLASAGIMARGLRDALDAGTSPADLLPRYAESGNIYYMALLDGREDVIDWVSRFEGYLPLTRRAGRHGETWTIDSPAGPILNIIVALPEGRGSAGHLYLGYSLAPLRDMERRGRINFLLLFAALAGAGLIVFRGVYALHRHALARAEQALAAEKEKERMKQVSGLTAGVAHEIKNPLNGLALLLDHLKDRSPADLRPDIDLGQEEVRRIARTIDVFADGLKPLVLRPETVDLSLFLEEVRKSFETESRGMAAEVAIGIEGRPRLRADVELLGRALVNLVRNGLEAAPGGRVEIRAGEEKGRITIRVADTGPGVPESERERIFEPFHSTKDSGMGIGLFLVRKIVEAHGGSIRLEDRPIGTGASFLVKMPGEPS